MISICSIWLNSSIPSFSFHSPAAVALLRCFSLHALVADLVLAQVDFFYGLVDAERVGEGLQSWHEAKAKWTANSWAFHCSCAELPALSTGSSACLAPADCQTPRSPAKLGLPLPTPAEPSAAHHRYFSWTVWALWWSGWGATRRPGPGAKCAKKQKTHRPGHWRLKNLTILPPEQMETEQGKSQNIKDSLWTDLTIANCLESLQKRSLQDCSSYAESCGWSAFMPPYASEYRKLPRVTSRK